MARFVFELEAVLRQRVAEEEERQRALAELERERGMIESLIRGYQQDLTLERGELREQLEAGGGVRLDLRGVRFQAGASLRLVTLAQRAVLQLAGVHKRIDAARLLLMQATVRRKGVELLRERRAEQWRREQDRKENAAADELNVMGAWRGNGEQQP